MTLPITKEVLAAAYDYLATTSPFVNWNLPDSEDVAFSVVRSAKEFAHYKWDGRRHTIAVSSTAVGHTITLLTVMSHEMVHLHLEQTGMESKGGDENTHNMAFRKLAAQVCKVVWKSYRVLRFHTRSGALRYASCGGCMMEGDGG